MEKRKPGRPKKIDAPVKSKRSNPRRKQVLKRSDDMIVADVVKSLAGRHKDCVIEVCLNDRLTLKLLPELVKKLPLDHTIFFSDPDQNKATEMNRTIYNLPNTENRANFMHASQLGMGWGNILVFGTLDSAEKFFTGKDEDEYASRYDEVIIASEF